MRKSVIDGDIDSELLGFIATLCEKSDDSGTVEMIFGIAFDIVSKTVVFGTEVLIDVTSDELVRLLTLELSPSCFETVVFNICSVTLWSCCVVAVDEVDTDSSVAEVVDVCSDVSMVTVFSVVPDISSVVMSLVVPVVVSTVVEFVVFPIVVSSIVVVVDDDSDPSDVVDVVVSVSVVGIGDKVVSFSLCVVIFDVTSVVVLNDASFVLFVVGVVVVVISVVVGVFVVGSVVDVVVSVVGGGVSVVEITVVSAFDWVEDCVLAAVVSVVEVDVASVTLLNVMIDNTERQNKYQAMKIAYKLRLPFNTPLVEVRVFEPLPLRLCFEHGQVCWCLINNTETSKFQCILSIKV